MTSPKKGSLRLESIKQPQNVKVLILCQNKTTIKQFYFIRTYTNLMKIDLSYNKLALFPSGFTFASFSHLRTLFLHYNKFSTLKNLVPVVESKTIYYLTLFGNPLEEAKARHLCVNQIGRLMLMDDKVVNIQERSQSIDLLQKQNKILSFPLIASKQAGEETTERYLQNVIKQLVIVRRNYLEVNPLIKIQRWWRHHLRLKGRKWKIFQLPLQQRIHSIISNLQKSRTELGRLVTEKMEIARSKQDIVYAILIKNWQFWSVFKQITSTGQLYLSRQYCDLNAIDYKEIQQIKVIRHFAAVNDKDLRKKKFISFFLHYHHRFVIRKMPKNQQQRKKLEISKMKSVAKNISMNPQRLQAINRKLQDLQATYHYYVKPKLSFDVLFAILKKQYYVFQKALLLNFQPDPFPFFSQELVRRTTAAVSIQRYWRGIKVRRRMDLMIKINQEKAAVRLQRWLRKLKFHHRYKFLLEVNSYLKQQSKSNEIAIQIGRIPAIQKYCTYKQQSGHNFAICFQRNSFTITKQASLSYYNSVNRSKIVFFAQRRPDPEYLFLTLSTDTSKIATAPLPQQQSTILQILFKNAKSIQKVTDSKGSKYLKFTYQSVEQTLNRKFILGLKTYRMANHQFIKSQHCPIVPAQYTQNLIDLMNEAKLVSMIDADTKVAKEASPANWMSLLQNQRSMGNLDSGVNIIDEVIFMKIRFFLGKVDYSCQLVIKSPDYGQKRVPKDTSLNSIREGYYYSRKKSISKRYQDQYTEQMSKISRKIISLDKDKSQPNTSRKNSVVYPKILNTDQSHSYIQSLSPKNSYSKIPQAYDKFDKEVYPPKTQYLRDSLRYKRQLDEIDSMRQKRSIIEEIKSSHKDRILEIAEKRQQQLNSLKQMKNKEQMQYSLQILKLKEEIEKEKANKKDRIKKRMNSRTDTFQRDFMKKGIQSINKEMREFQKKNRSNRQYKVLQARFQRDSIKQQQRQIQKTEIKEFSINFSDNEQTLKITEHEKDIDKLEVEQELMGKNNHLKSNVSQQKRLGSQEKEESKHLKSESIQMKSDYQQRKRLKKKKMVHSVFPEQFYPLKQSKQLGFQLPRLSKN